nr:MAG TPA: hypothetical protein [Caudoviricetes sp.]
MQLRIWHRLEMNMLLRLIKETLQSIKVSI